MKVIREPVVELVNITRGYSGSPQQLCMLFQVTLVLLEWMVLMEIRGPRVRKA